MGARMRAPVWLTLRREHVGVRLVVVWATIVLRDVPMGGYGWVKEMRRWRKSGLARHLLAGNHVIRAP